MQVCRRGGSGGKAPLNDPLLAVAGFAHIASGCPQHHPAQRLHLSLSSRHYLLKERKENFH